jgi:3-hydroxyisobutyrate dehydrogenase-like beta-hydroxyacid dehydrogenase
MGDNVGFIGLGEMGKWMALNLVKAGHALLVSDVRPEPRAELTAAGAEAVSAPRQLAERCSRIVLSLPDTAAVEAVLFGAGGLAAAARPGLIIADCGTTHPLFTRQAAARLAALGVTLLDAPVSGMEARAKAGTLTIMVGGDVQASAAMEPLFRAMGDTVRHLGASGAGQLAKMVNNVLFNISCAAMAELLPLAVKLGLDAGQVVDVVRTGTGQSYGFDFFAPLALERNFRPGYPMQSAYKDMTTVMEVCAGEGVELPVTGAAFQTYTRALEAGYGRENKGAMIKVFERLLGVEVLASKGEQTP